MSREIDASWDHLYPDFRAKLKKVLSEAPGGPWKLVEGYRSQARQTWLYAQGRTRPGSIVTWMKTPRNHGAGLAADVIPAAGYNAPRATWEGLRAAYLRHGLENPAWKKGDLGHVQWPASDEQANEEARDWCEAGFPTQAEPELTPLTLRGVILPFKGELRNGTTWVPLRPLCDELNLVIHTVQGDEAKIAREGDEVLTSVPLEITNGRGYSPIRDVAAVAGLLVRFENGAVALSA